MLIPQRPSRDVGLEKVRNVLGITAVFRKDRVTSEIHIDQPFRYTKNFNLHFIIALIYYLLVLSLLTHCPESVPTNTNSETLVSFQHTRAVPSLFYPYAKKP